MKKEKILEVIIFAVVLLIPIIYSFFYLKSYWDPYGDLKGLKIAVVNLDDGENNENQGNEFLKSLQDDGTFDICPVTLDEANEGMQNGKYYATITIPSNFTKSLNSASTTDKQISTITYSPNQASNYLSSQIINSAVKTMEINLQAKVSSAIVGNLSDNLRSVPDSLGKISDASGQLLNGSETLTNGIKEINDGTTTLNNNYTEFNTGVNSAYEGSKTLESGFNQVSSGVDTLNTGSASLNNAVSQINSGVNELAVKGVDGVQSLSNGITDINNGAKDLSGKLSTYVDGTTSLANGTIGYINGTNYLLGNVNGYVDSVNESNTRIFELLTELSELQNSEDANAQKLAVKAKNIIESKEIESLTKSGVDLKKSETTLTMMEPTIVAGANKLIGLEGAVRAGANGLYAGTQRLAKESQSLGQITSGITNLQSALAQVQTGTKSLQSGVGSLKNGTTKLLGGSNSLKNGLEKLDSSSTQVKAALNKLSAGTNSLYSGSTQLTDGLQEFNDEINKNIETTNNDLKNLSGIEDFAEDPVEFKTEEYGEVNSYGIAFTPLFLCIGLWVGALMCYVVLYYDQKHRFGILDHNSERKFLQNIIYIAIGAIQGIIVAALLKIGLGYEVQNSALYYFASILIGVTFTSIIQFLIRNFGDVGKFLALIILVLQLAASGGTFPIETIDKGFQAVTPYLPMTYSIKLLREILVPTATNFKGSYIMILMSITICTLAITYAVDIAKNKKLNEKGA